MKITKDHYTWWMSKQPKPSIFGEFKPPVRVSIHQLINVQIPQKRPNATVHNTYVVINNYRYDRDKLTLRLWELYHRPGCSEPAVRSKICMRLIRRYYKAIGYSKRIIREVCPNGR